MRTTVTLEPDVEASIREACYRRNKSFKRVINDALRESFKSSGASAHELLAPRPMGLAPGIDPRRLSELADELEVAGLMAAEEKANYNRKQK